MPRDLSRPRWSVGVDDHELVSVGADPDTLVDQRARDGVERAADRDRGLPGHLARLAEAQRVRALGQRVQPRALLQQEHCGRLARHAMLARVDALAEGAARVLELREI